MALFSNKTEDEKTEAVVAPKKEAVKTAKSTGSRTATMMLIPRVSEKAQSAASARKYIFVVPTTANKVEVRKQVEIQFGVKVGSVNMIRMEGKPRRYGRSTGQMSDYKKAIITLTKDSKDIATAEAA